MSRFFRPPAPVLTLALALPFAVPVAAQSSVANRDDPALTLGTLSTVDVRATATGALSARNVFSSVDLLGASLLEDQHVDFSWELFSRAPGVQVTPFRQGTDAGRFSFRGFNGEGRVNAVKLLIDGIPSNDNAGGMPFLDAVSPLDIESIEIVRGTNDPRYGLNNIAGNVDVRTRIGGNDGRASVTLGSFGTRETQIAKGIENGNWSQNYFLGWRDSDGYRDHADARKINFAGKWFYTSDDGRWRTGVIARYYRNKALESGYQTFAEATQSPRSSPSYAQADRSERETRQLSAYLDGQLTDALSWSTRAYFNRYENQRFVRFSAAGLQQERDNDETQRGASSTLTWRPKVDWAHEFTLEGGVDAQWQDNAAQRYRTVDRVRTSQFRAWDFDLDTQGAYVQAVIRPTEALKIVPALRIDHVGGHFTDQLTGTTSPVYDYGLIRQPKLSVAYTLAPAATVYGNWGRTFQIGTGIDAYRTQARNLAPSLNDGWEAGLKFSPAAWLDGRVAYWEQRASGEVARVLGVNGVADPGGLGNIGKTLRKGFDLQLNAHPSARLTAWAAYSHQVARVTEPDPSAPATLGREIENVPHYLWSAGLDYQAAEKLKLSAWANGQGAYYVERTNTLGRFGQYTLLNLGATYRLSPTVDLNLQVKNVTNRKYVYAWYDSGSSGFSAGDGRGVYASASWKF
ncbi:TonB-dependent receptor [Variovorax ginsengisoli]|uniref:Iron complex outermembrane receptor protein n=1 Tax=Variovorax ginsengisoli TaxID=363844 RepID=A0ABT9S2S5_9BURK|nr:TonB-dependent receptor [Variovorax ginsengisoli]MDP9898650.1 iron complex outermembrane receptor protein [Variovorax ginsengisoli]